MEVTVNPAYLHLGQKKRWKIMNVLKKNLPGVTICLFYPMESK